MTVSGQIRSEAHSLGFAHCGFARAGEMDPLRPFYAEFVSQKRDAGMHYLKRYTKQRLNPELLLPGIRSVIALLMNYFPKETIPEEENLIIAKYAYGKDYHPFMKKRLKEMVAFLDNTFPGSRSRSFIDSGPVLEKAWAQRCGVGWQGKHTVLINRQEGSFFFIGIIFTTIDLIPDEPGLDHCGTCTRCIDACPTGALHNPYRLEISRCLSYHTIENRGEIPRAVRGKFNHRIFGCDICQDVCPWNKHAKRTQEDHFQMLPGLMKLRKKDWMAMTEQEFNHIFRDSGIRRTGYQTVKRNITLASDAPGPEKD